MIELHRPQFSVIGIAANGREALDMIGRLGPDLVITDVKMPVMDGIELVAELKLHFPDLPAVIVSGHQEFEYVRRALDTGVVDYLLKPVNPTRLAEVLDRLAGLFCAREGSARAEGLLHLVKGDGRGGPQASDELFWLAAVRVGGLPSRFRFDKALGEETRAESGLFNLPGRDSRERVYLGPKAGIGHAAFSAAVCALHDGAGASFRTVLISYEPRLADQLQAAVREICLDLDRLLVAGLSQVHYGKVKQPPEVEWDRALADRIEVALREFRIDLLEESIRSMADDWRAKARPLVYAESQLRGILHFVLRKTLHAQNAVASSLELLLDEALAGIGDFDQLYDSAWALVSKAAGAEDPGFRDSDVPAFFTSIRRYVEARYSEPLNLADLSRSFRISSSYLSKLFRKHAGRSFGEFLAALRIDAAKRLIRASPELPLKDVAEQVGYNDPFYFSRVFKSIAGLPPSDYSRLGRGEEPAQAE